jgi:hypothetical protein
MKILYVDYIFQKGHVNFNRIHIDALKSEGNDVKIVTHRQIASLLPYATSEYALLLPPFFRYREGHPFKNRMIYLLALLWIRLHVPIGRFDQVIVSFCDEITLSLLPLCRHMYIICHGNAGALSNPLKRFCLYRLSRHHSFIVFNDYMAGPFFEAGIRSVFVVSHGCVPPFPRQLPVDLPLDVSSFSRIVFHPSSKHDARFVDDLISHPRLQQILKENDVLLVIHDKIGNESETSHIRFINGFLPQRQYQDLFLQSDIILLAYPEEFRFQVSGVSFECVANGKRMLVKEHPSLTYCRQFYNYDPIFSSMDEMCDKLEYLVSHTEASCIVSSESLKPDYTHIFKMSQR